VNADSLPVTPYVDDNVVSRWPRVSGKPTAGSVVKVSAPARKPSFLNPKLRTSYQWQLDGTPVPGATSQSYVVQPGDAGKKLTVKVHIADVAPGNKPTRYYFYEPVTKTYSAGVVAG